MSLLQSGRAQVLIFPMVRVVDSDGNPVMRPSDTGVPVRGSVQPVSTDDAIGRYSGADDGQQVDAVYRFRPNRGEPVPFGAWDRVEWDGRSWDVIGDPNRHNSSPATARTVLHMRARTPRGV